jgi:hypothetical protein
MKGHSTLRAGLKTGSGGRETVKNESALDLGQSSWSG